MVLDQEKQRHCLIKERDYHDVIDKIYLYARDLIEPKYQFLIKKCEDAGIKYVNNPNVFIVYCVFKYDGWCLQRNRWKSLNCL